MVAAFAAMLLIAETAYEKGLSDFLTNTSSDLTLIGGILSGLIVSSTTTVIISICSPAPNDIRTGEEVWQSTLKIDNPLVPWKKLYKKELEKINVGTSIGTSDMKAIFKRTSILAYVGGACSIVVFLVIIPSITLGYKVLSLAEFNSWLTCCQIWVIVGAIFALFVPPLQETYQIIYQYLTNKKKEKYLKENISVELIT